MFYSVEHFNLTAIFWCFACISSLLTKMDETYTVFQVKLGKGLDITFCRCGCRYPRGASHQDVLQIDPNNLRTRMCEITKLHWQFTELVNATKFFSALLTYYKSGIIRPFYWMRCMNVATIMLRLWPSFIFLGWCMYVDGLILIYPKLYKYECTLFGIFKVVE